jgi:hypothetical protein
MTSQEIKKQITDMKKFTKKVTASKTLSRDFLVKAGICTENGNLKKAYK